MQSIFETDAKQPPSIDMFKPLPAGDGVIDEATFKTIEVDALFDAVNHCQTIAGKATLRRSLVNPHDSLAEIEAVQQALQELDQNPQLDQVLQQIIANTGASESWLCMTKSSPVRPGESQ